MPKCIKAIYMERMKNITNFFKIRVDFSTLLCYNKNNEREVIKMKKNKVNKSHLKKEGEELQLYLHFRKRGSVVENKKGKGSYKRKKKWGDEQ